MNSRLSLTLILLIVINSVSAQTSDVKNNCFLKSNSINIEIGGYTPLGTVNYERIIINNQKLKTSVQIGYGIEGIPIVFNELMSFTNHHLELGLGILSPEPLFNTYREITRLILTGRFGYRYQKPDSKFIFRVGLMPIAIQDRYGMYVFNGGHTWIWPGFSFGYAF